MHALIGKIITNPGSRDDLAAILLSGTRDMPGCLSYVIAHDLEDENALSITEVWESAEAHKASLSLPSVQDAIKAGRPLIARFEHHIQTKPIQGSLIQR